MVTYYHVAGDGWNPGEGLYSFDKLEQLGCPVGWKWDGEPIDTEFVCLFETLAEAQDMQAEYGGTILQVEVPAGERLIRVGEGYPAIYQEIPPEWVSMVA